MASADGGKASPTFSHHGPLALWLAIQLLVLLLPVLQVPLSDQFPRPAEGLAADEMVVAQVVAASMLFPLIFRSLRESLLLAAASWPFLELAGFLACTPAITIVLSGCYISMWFVVLGLWSGWLGSGKAAIVGCAVATALTLGGPLLWYLRSEFVAEPAPAQIILLSACSPTMGALNIVHQGPGVGYVWGAMLAALIANAVSVTLLRKRQNG